MDALQTYEDGWSMIWLVCGQIVLVGSPQCSRPILVHLEYERS